MNKFAVGLMIGLISFSAAAENAPVAPNAPAPAAEAPKPQVGKLKQLSNELGLSEEQEDKIKSLFKKHRQKIKEIRAESKEEIKETLTPAQKLKLYRLKEKHQDEIDALKGSLKGQGQP